MSTEHDRRSRDFEATYVDSCAHGDTIRPGETVRYEQGVLVHVTCRDAAVKPTRFQGSSDDGG